MNRVALRILGLALAVLLGTKGVNAQASIYVPGKVVFAWGDTLHGQINRFIRYSSDLKFRFSPDFPSISIDFDDVHQFQLAQIWYARKKVRGKGEIYIEDLFTEPVGMYRLGVTRGRNDAEPYYLFYFEDPEKKALIPLTSESFHLRFLPLLEAYPSLWEGAKRIGNKPVQLLGLMRRSQRK